MRFKKIILPLSIISVTAPIFAAVSCGADSKVEKTDNAVAINDLKKRIDDLNKQLDSVKGAKQDQQSQDTINNLTSQLANLKNELDSLQPKEEVVAKVLTMKERDDAYKAFFASNLKDLDVVSFDDLKNSLNPDVPWQRGISTFALAQGGSYIYNLALKLGYQKQISDIEDLSVSTPSGDLILDNERNTVYNKLKNVFDNIKPLSGQPLAKLIGSDSFKKFSFNTSNGGHLSQERLILSGLDISSMGQAYVVSKAVANGKTDNHAFDYANFKYTSATGDNILIGENNKLKGMKYWSGEKPGANIIRFEVPATYEKDSAGASTDVMLTKSFSREYVVDGLQPTFPKETSSERKHDLTVLEAFTKKLNTIFSEENKASVEQLKSVAELVSVSKEFIGALEFIGQNFNAENGFTMDDVAKAYDSLNNGSHYFKAVETFFRGVSGVSFQKGTFNNTTKTGMLVTAPQPTDLDYTHEGFLGAPLNHLEVTLDAWAGINGSGAYVFSQDKFILTDIKDYSK